MNGDRHAGMASTRSRVAPTYAFGASGSRKSRHVVYFLVVGMLIAAGLFVTVGRETAATLLMAWIVLGCAYYAFTRFEDALCLFAFAVPLEQVFYAWGGGRFNTLTYLVIFMLLVWLARSRRAHGLRAVEILALLWIGWFLCAVSWADSLSGIGEIVTYSGALAVLYLYSRALPREAIVRCLWFFMAGTFLVTLALLLYYEPGEFRVWHVEDQKYRMSALGSGTQVAPPEYARAASISALAALALWETEKRKLRKLLFLGSALL